MNQVTTSSDGQPQYFDLVPISDKAVAIVVGEQGFDYLVREFDLRPGFEWIRRKCLRERFTGFIARIDASDYLWRRFEVPETVSTLVIVDEGHTAACDNWIKRMAVSMN